MDLHRGGGAVYLHRGGGAMDLHMGGGFTYGRWGGGRWVYKMPIRVYFFASFSCLCSLRYAFQSHSKLCVPSGIQSHAF